MALRGPSWTKGFSPPPFADRQNMTLQFSAQTNVNEPWQLKANKLPVACNPENPLQSCKSCFRQRPPHETGTLHSARMHPRFFERQKGGRLVVGEKRRERGEQDESRRGEGEVYAWSGGDVLAILMIERFTGKKCAPPIEKPASVARDVRKPLSASAPQPPPHHPRSWPSPAARRASRCAHCS